MANALFFPPEYAAGPEGPGDEGMRLLLEIEELRAGMAMLAACLEAAMEEPGPAPSADPGFLCAYA